MRPAVSLSKATRMPVRSRSAAWLIRAACWLVRAVPHGASPACRPGSAVVTAMASNGPSTMTGVAPLRERRAGVVQPEQQAAFPVRRRSRGC